MLVYLYVYVYVYLFVLAIAPAATSVAAKAGRMDRLPGLDISPNLSKDDFLLRLRRTDVNILKEIRICLFDTAKRSALVNQYDILVDRRNTTTRPAAWKLAEDIIWELRTCAQMKKAVPRSLLPSGKRSKQQFEAQRGRTREKTANYATLTNGNASVAVGNTFVDGEQSEREGAGEQEGTDYRGNGGAGRVVGNNGDRMDDCLTGLESQGNMAGGRVEGGYAMESCRDVEGDTQKMSGDFAGTRRLRGRRGVTLSWSI